MSDVKIGDPDIQTPQIRTERGACAGCPQWSKCLFHMPRYGGFKTHGKRYVAYALITDRTENSNGMENFCTCETFVETLQDRMLSGRAAADEGRKGAEIVRLLVGKNTVTQGLEMGFNGRGEIVKPQPNQVEDLKRAGYKVNLDDKGDAVSWQLVEFERTIPDYKEPKKGTGGYSNTIAAREAEFRRSEMEDEDTRWEERLQDMPQKKRGRPPGSRNRSKEDGDDFEGAHE